jgi:hypothetical protein
MARQPLWALASFQFPDLFTICRSRWTSDDQLVARPLPKHRTAQTQNEHIYSPSIRALMGFEPTITASGRAKAVHASDRSATVTGSFTLFYSLALQPNSGLGRLHETFRFTSVTRFMTVGRTPWTGDQLVTRPLPVHKHRKTHTQQKH